MIGLLIFTAAFLLSAEASHLGKINTVLQWKTLEYDYDDAQRQEDLDSGFYVRKVPIPIDVDVHYNGSSRRVFVTMPRWQMGTPATLTEYIGENSDGTPILRPYPSWEWHRNVSECRKDRLVDVFRVKIDTCGRMWVLDDGKYAGRVFCPPQLLTFDLATNQLVNRVTIPNTMVIPKFTELVTPIVDIRDGKCDEAIVYIADNIQPGIITYNLKTRVMSKATHRTMYANPYYGSYDILGYKFDLMDGVLGMDLEPYTKGRDRTLFYTAVSSVTMNSVKTSVLQNQEEFLENQNAEREAFKEYYTRRQSQAAGIAIDRNGIMYFGDLIRHSILCWNTKSFEYGMFVDSVYKNRTTMQFASGVKVIDHPSGTQELWVLTSRFQRIVTDTLDVNDVNFRVSMGKIPQILKGTACGKPNRIPYYMFNKFGV